MTLGPHRFFGLLLALLLTGCLGSHNRPMQLINGAGPIYPAAARQAGVEGLVVVRYDVTQEGNVINAVVAESEPAGVFDEAALVAVRSWHFNPRIVEGEPQLVEGIVSPVRFRVDDDDAYANH